MFITKLSKKQALLFFALIYIVAFIIGWIVQNIFLHPGSPLWMKSLILDIVATIVIWIVGLVIRNQSIYDPYWSVFPPILLGYWLILQKTPISLPNTLIFISVLVWSIRLTYNFVINFSGFNYQDWRYVMLKAKKPRLWFLTNLFGINMMPTLIVFIQMLSILPVIGYTGKVNIIFLIGIFISIGAAVLQYISDKQMRIFRLIHSTKKACMRDGLWAYSRHPNYFGEVSFWWGLWVMYVGITGNIDLYVVSPILMTLLFLLISIPMMEKKILQTRPEYKDIQNEISGFIPTFWRKPNQRDSVLNEQSI
jgi:steroid 5-alpha reductase family enzyme